MESTRPIEHVKVLCEEIGPRGPTTEEEARAAAYAASKLEEIGARQVSVEPFWSVPSLWWSLEIASALALASTWLFLFGRGTLWGVSVFFLLLTIYIIVAELSFWRLSLSNLLPKRLSQNVYGKVFPKRESKNKLVVIGHLDTNRTPVLFHRRIVKFMPGMLAAMFACIVLKAIGFSVSSLVDDLHAKIFVASLILDGPIFLMLLAMLHGDLISAYTEGANDNATGAAIVLSLADVFTREPLERTEYWALCTGCEEATLTGIKDFLKRHSDELRDAWFVDLECLGIGNLRYVTYEGMLKKYYSNSGLVRAAVDAAHAVGDPSIGSMSLTSGYTETAIVLGKGHKGITIMAFPEGAHDVPHWHQVSDKISNVDPEGLDRALRYIVTLAQELDSE
jgi:hypothetical protein